LYYADSISFYSPTQLCGGGSDKFDEYIKATEKPLTDTISKIAKDVKDFEDHQKALRLDTVKSYIANKSAIRYVYERSNGQVENGWAVSLALSLYLDF
ncbi:hypothetical protein PZH43_14415, partial [Streptococcus gordonii]|nr:hypothetical protein [Streptococcus gordonii]